MCEPVTIMTALAVTTAAASAYGQYKTGKAQAKMINEQNELQQDEIAKAAGQQLTERARAARRERASMRAIGSEMGLNLDTSGSFLSALQNSAMSQYNDSGLIVQNEQGQQRARAVNAKSQLNQVQIPTALSSALTIGSAGYGTYQNATALQKAAAQKGAS